MADRYRGTMYIGATADLARRMSQNRDGRGSAFVTKYKLFRLVHAEHFERIDEAIAREKALKRWLRSWKIELVEKANPNWLDLYEQLIGA
jgi:putative endonuclease